MSDTDSVATFLEPYYSGFHSALVDVQIGEFGVAEQRPATWVEVQVGARAREVAVKFADGTTDSMVPARGIAVLAHSGEAATALGGGGRSRLVVTGAGGVVLARYSIGVGNPVAEAPLPDSLPPSTGRSRPSDPAAATAAVDRALHNALSCDEPPVAQSGYVVDGGAYELQGGAGGSGLSQGDVETAVKVVFDSATTATVQYEIASPGSGAGSSGLRYATAQAIAGTWLVSLSSVAPGLQVAPADQDGTVAVAPGGPLEVDTEPGGVAVATYRAQRSEPQGQSDCFGTCTPYDPSPSCVPTGGLVEEISTPGAVGVESEPLFGNDPGPVIGIGMNIVGEAEGSDATAIGAEVASDVSEVEVVTRSGTETLRPTYGHVESVFAGAPSQTIGSPGASLVAVGSSGSTLETVPLTVDASEPAAASSLPTALPSPGTPPRDQRAATDAIDRVFTTVFDCADSPLVRSSEIQDDGMFSNPLEQLYDGPYTSLVESVYATVGDVVFVNPDLADVSYTIRFRSDSTLSFPLIGSAALVDGTWRVSYATLCAAVALGGVSCSS